MRHSSPTRRRGFTLVELLVVIAIIGTLVALLLPAVQNAREAARNNTCKNNMRQLAVALTNYDSNTGYLPGYINDIENVRSQKDNTNGQYTKARQASWVVMIFDYMEQPALWDAWSEFHPDYPSTNLDTVGGFTPELEMLICPSDEPDIPGNPWLSYVGNSGRMFSDTTRGSDLGEYAPNGVFLDRSVNLNAIPTAARDNRENPKTAQISMNYISSGDGTSNTALLSESLHSFYWTYTDGASSNPSPRAESRNKGSMFADDKKWFGFVWSNDGSSDCSSNTDFLRINGIPPNVAPLQFMQNLTDCHGYPSSNHPSGVNMAFCDARVEYINETIEPQVYGQLMTSNSKRSQFEWGNVADRNLPPVSDDQY